MYSVSGNQSKPSSYNMLREKIKSDHFDTGDNDKVSVRDVRANVCDQANYAGVRHNGLDSLAQSAMIR